MARSRRRRAAGVRGDGNGPIAALVDGFEHSFGVAVKVRDYHEHAMAASASATAAAYVEADVDDDAVWGVGLHSNIATASLRGGRERGQPGARAARGGGGGRGRLRRLISRDAAPAVDTGGRGRMAARRELRRRSRRRRRSVRLRRERTPTGRRSARRGAASGRSATGKSAERPLPELSPTGAVRGWWQIERDGFAAFASEDAVRSWEPG